ncbi:serine hydrolase domain-containing protein [Flavihumibacter cheonanensis]|uniref:serine hydrolase domain-containing protein n=1 Tax=Flavihumibacter cheonanensis TaxID=1442385 RepID=UPI001EF75C95|nr:serine hydrolase domain-containing protein [Flavihumibacter cheonanensis]MCG7752142.1 beta-lactamase family protein [Flavihumibacter cheonanensis]
MYKKIIQLFICSFITVFVQAQSVNINSNAWKSVIKETDQLFTDFATKNNQPGYIYGIVANGKLVHLKTSGMANREMGNPVKPGSVFRIASMSKSFAGVAILQLRDQGKLQLDEPAQLYIPELSDIQYPTTDAPPITIRHLLTHAAGFPEDNPWGDRQLDISEDSMHAMFKRGISFSTSPGTAYEYSNMGFAMLGAIIKKVSGMSYQEYIEEYIWKPLGMHHTYWEYSAVPDSTLAIGYRWLNSSWEAQPMEHDGAYGIMGGILTTAEDFSRYMNFMLSAWPARNGSDNSPLQRSSLREMQQPWNFAGLNPNYKYPDGRICPTAAGYGYGLRWSKDCEGRITVGHSGGLPGFGSNWTILPEYGIGIVSFINQTYAPATTLNIQSLDLLVKKAELQPRAVPPSPILLQRQQELTALLPDWKNAEQSSIFAENFFFDYQVDSLRKEAKSVFQAAGKILRSSPIIAENNLRGTFTLHGEKADLNVYFTLSPEQPAKIQAYRIRLEPREK